MAFTNKSQFLGIMYNFENEVSDATQNLVKRMARVLLHTAITLSPVDTGRFVSSWRINDGRPVDTGLGQHSSSEALSASNSYIAGYKLGQPIWLTNGTPYGRFIEYGAPTIEAHYIVDQAVAAATASGFGGIR